MRLNIIAQYLNLAGPGEDRLYKLGLQYAARGHDVTVFSISNGSGLDPRKKKIGVMQDGGLVVITFNVPYDPAMSDRQKFKSFVDFARLVGKQGRLLPPPDVIIALSPPLSAVWPALRLSKRYGAPLVTEIRELWPDAPVHRESLSNRLLIRGARRLEEQVYEHSQRIIAGSPGIAEAVKARWIERAKISVIPALEDEDKLIGLYDQVLQSVSAEIREEIKA